MRLLVAAVLLTACSSTLSASHWPTQPDPKLTPGAVLNVTAAQVCLPGYASKVRNVPVSEAKAVFATYGVPYSQRSRGELDHLVSLELGGSNDMRNLWPQYGPRPNRKDAYENELHAAVCNGSMTLAAAQKAIVNPANWPK